MKLKLSALLFFTALAVAYAQQTPPPVNTTGELPFAIADEKQLSDEDLADKKEGMYVTGVPELSSDPINGFGYGAEGALYFNGKKTDPFFKYTPYRAEITAVLFNTTKNQREAAVGVDIPYVFNSKWRLRGEAAYEINPNLLYFGINESSLDKLSYYPNNDHNAPPVTNSRYKAYENNLSTVQNDSTSHFYNGYTKQEAILNISAEHVYFDSKMRLLVGFEAAQVNISAYDGSTKYQGAVERATRITQDYNAGKIVGLGKNFIDIVQVGAVWDTRDLEPDPSKGVFAEVTNELSLRPLGSKFNFNKTFGQVKVYKKILPSVFKKLIFAGRYGMGYTAGNAPFFEYQDQWSSEGSIEGLGGPTTLRGYKQSRFLGRLMNFANLELRYRFTQFDLFKQHFALSAVPFFDIGGVWNGFSDFNKFGNYRYNEGLGLRIAWNVNTIIRLDYAYSQEDAQFFFNLAHAF